MVGAWGVGGLAGPMAPLLAVPPASKHRGRRCYGVVGACMVAMVTSKEMLPFALQALPPLRQRLPSSSCQ